MSKQTLQLNWYNKDMALIPEETGKYGYRWVDPADPRYCETHVLVMDEYISGKQSPKSEEYQYSERADLQPQDDNLLILGESGDVLETLTRTPELKNKYVGQVKLVYIDPPFNTEQTFESYEDNLEHSIWLTMMRDRLLHLKRLLSENGSIWVHLDTSENHRMRLLMDEVFNAKNFVAEIMWHKTTSSKNDNLGISIDHDVIIVYAKNIQSALSTWNGLARSAASEAAYSNPDNDPRGPWREDNYKMKKGSYYPIIHPITGEEVYPPPGQSWRYSEETHKKHIEENKIFWGFTGNYKLPKVKRFRSEVSDFRVPTSVWTKDEVDTNRRAKQHLKELFGSDEFSTPKPERLLERIIHIASNPGDIVLDCFAGSGTTAAVAQKMGRRWVTCELLAATFNKFTLPRLKKVIMNEDDGGISRTKGERIASDGVELPEGVSPEDASKFISILNKVIADDDDLKKNDAIKQLKKMTKTNRSKEIINWRGGGGFQIAHLAPECFDYDEELDRVILTNDAKGDLFIKSVAANLGFSILEDSSVFDAKKGRVYLKVLNGIATPETVEWLASQTGDEESFLLAAIGVMDGVREMLRKIKKGSRIVIVPDDLFHYSKGGME